MNGIIPGEGTWPMPERKRKTMSAKNSDQGVNKA
jgi:hypothetical protein